MLLGGGYYGQRLNKIYRESVSEPEILAILRPMIKRYALERLEGEHFGDFVIRAGYIAPTMEGKNWYDRMGGEGKFREVAAQTCRAFHEPAAAIIWQQLIGFWPILRLLPEATATTWAESREAESESDERHGPPIVITRPLTLEEWLMVKQLSQRVRNVHVFVTQRPHCYSLTPGSLSFLLHPPGNESLESLFPNVQHLTFRCQGFPSLEAARWQDSVLALLRILIRPQLSLLELHLDGRFYASLNASGILASCSNLRTLYTSTATFETQEGARVSVVPTISSLQSLETARIYGVSWDLLASLAQIKTLQRLFVNFGGPLGSPLPLINEAFAGLRYLDTHITSLELSLSFYRWIPLGQLRGLTILATDFARNDYSEDLEELLTLIPEHGPSLETINVNLGFAPPRQPRHWLLTKSILTPYLSLRNLKMMTSSKWLSVGHC
ncbi:hypothetical protein PISMIDRAFT_19701 [Pisolithus microcarpus 441]|uniref:Uncharacterized protein n=1 Tax=Pisolithus microcarpus 441 TaxID=765257 RepID=A0A0C9YB51_9AGAM|nr:hypothetical protein PISMIDRAFT_19701 [Pisolithus microcarpus 441]